MTIIETRVNCKIQVKRVDPKGVEELQVSQMTPQPLDRPQKHRRSKHGKGRQTKREREP